MFSTTSALHFILKNQNISFHLHATIRLSKTIGPQGLQQPTSKTTSKPKQKILQSDTLSKAWDDQVSHGWKSRPHFEPGAGPGIGHHDFRNPRPRIHNLQASTHGMDQGLRWTRSRAGRVLWIWTRRGAKANGGEVYDKGAKPQAGAWPHELPGLGPRCRLGFHHQHTSLARRQL